MPFCSNCGTEVAAGIEACPQCGHPQGAASYRATPLRRTDGTAVTALVLGIAGLVICPLVPSIFAIVLGNQSKAKIAADPMLDGEQLASAGVILGWVGVALAGLAIVAAAVALIFFTSGTSTVNFGP